MRVAFIAPPDFLKYLLNSEYHLTLPWTIKAYRNQRITGYYILDNGEAEGRRASNDKLIELATEYDVDEIVVPDAIGDYRGTLDLIQEFRPLAQKHDTFRYMGVVQGSKWQEVVNCANLLRHEDWIQAIAIPKHLPKTLEDKFARYRLAEFLHDKEWVRDFHYGIHFLGATDWLREVTILNEFPGARGIDTSVPVVAGMRHININELRHGRVEREDGYFDVELSMELISWITQNMDIYMRWAGDE